MKKYLYNTVITGLLISLFLFHVPMVNAADLASEFNNLSCSLAQNHANFTISGGPANLPLQISTSSQLAGAISSLTVNGMETLDTPDHGRGIQYAFFIGGGMWDPNPTEAGSAYDGLAKNPSSSTFLEGCAMGNKLYTKSQMAYWIPVDGAKLSPYVMSKIVQIGVGNMPNLIRFVTKIHVPSGVVSKKWLLNDPAVYFKYFFNKLSLFDIPTQTVRTPGKNEFTKDGDHYVYYVPYNQLSAVSNGQYTLVPYVAENTYGPIYVDAYAEYPGNTVQDGTNVTIPTLKAGDYYFESYLLISPNATAVTDMKTLTKTIPQQINGKKPPAKPGDLNGDGVVNILDYNTLLSGFGTKYTLLDYNTLVANFGK